MKIQQTIISLARKAEPVKSTLEPEKPNVDVTAEWIINKLNIKF